MDGGRERGGTRMRCVCMRMDCLQTQINVNKKQKRKNLLMGRGGRQSVFLRVHADVDGGHRHLACACGRGWGTWARWYSDALRVRADGLPADAD